MDPNKEKDPNIFEYDNYRKYLKDYYEAKKAQKQSFSYRAFSKKAGFNSPNFLKLVMEGKRNLSHDSIEKCIDALALRKEEAGFYKNLVQFNQAKTVEQKHQFAKEIIRSKVYKKLKPLSQAQYQYWSRWYNIVIREMVALECFKEDPEWIANHLVPKITTDEAKNSLKQLLKIGVIKRNDKGKLIQAQTDVTAGDEVVVSSMGQFHQEMIEKAKESIDRFKGKHRQISSITCGLSEKSAEKLKQMINKFRKDIIDLSNREREATRVYQVNFQLFPMSDNEGVENSYED